MPRPRFSRLPADKRHRILEVAAIEFATRGFHAASLNRIIEQAGISKGAAYYYFDDKADLFAAVVRHAWGALRPPAPPDVGALTAETFWSILRQEYDALLARVEQQPWLLSVGKLVYGRLPSREISDLVAAEFREVRRQMAALVERGQSVGAVRRDLPAELLVAVLVAVLEAADRWAVEHPQVLTPTAPVPPAVFRMLRDLAEPVEMRR